MNKLLLFIIISCTLSAFLYLPSTAIYKNDLDEVYSISETIYMDNNETNNQYIDIRYPQISDLQDDYVEKLINTQIEVFALNVLDEFSTLDDMEISVTYSLDCVTPNYLSLHFIRKSFHIAQAYPLIKIISINFDINSGKKILLRDLVRVDEYFVESYFDNFKLQGNYQSHDEKSKIHNYVYDYISIDKFYNCGEYIESDYQYYFSNDTLFISISIPYSVGSYAFYEAN